MGWEDQGRQEHAWFGSGTSPASDNSNNDSAPSDAELARRLGAVIYGAVAAMPPALQTSAAARLDTATRVRLNALMATWSRGGNMDRSEFTMAKYSDQQAATTQDMNSPIALLVPTCASSGDPAFILACDDVVLRWLSQSFRDLANSGPFAIGNGHPVHSDGKCVIEVRASPDENHAAMTSTAAGRFDWTVPHSRADQHADLINGMASFPNACLQYLEAPQSEVPIVVISKGEYSIELLRRMRDEKPF